MLDYLKKLPIDLGQGNLRFTTKGKLIALSFVKNGYGKTALDVGCREGVQTKWLKDRGYEVKSVDIKKVFKNCIIVDLNEKLPFNDKSFDLIWCSEVLEHLDNPVFIKTEFRRVLKPKGEMILTTPNSYSWIFLFGLLATKMQRKDHKQFFSIKDIKKLFPDAEIYGYFPYVAEYRYKISKWVGVLSPTFIIRHKENV